MRDLARFDVVRATAKGTRPPSRIFNIKVFESRPDAIRAIPWTRALLAGGLHSELIGVGQFAVRQLVQGLLHALDAGWVGGEHWADAETQAQQGGG